MRLPSCVNAIASVTAWPNSARVGSVADLVALVPIDEPHGGRDELPVV